MPAHAINKFIAGAGVSIPSADKVPITAMCQSKFVN